MKIKSEDVKKHIGKHADLLIKVRRHLHSHPELSFQEFKTSEFIAEILDKHNIAFEQGMVKTGIVGVIKGRNPDKKVVALRADIDALPIQEKNEVSYASKNNGVMHACGHDVHTTCLIGALITLNELKEDFEGSVKFIFQPGEEKLPGGASLMIKEGVLKNPEPSVILGQHVFTDLPAGKVGFRSGKYMASADEIYITVKGKGGHAALPQETIDPILIASHMVVSLQQIVSRNAHPLLPSVLSFGKIIGLGATNVIPDEVELEGTFRTFDENWRSEAHEKIEKMVNQIAEGMGGKAEVNIKKGYPFVTNDEAVTNRARKAAQLYLGEENVEELALRMTAEDFGYFSHALPSTFYRLGTADPSAKQAYKLHTSTFNVDEKAIVPGAGLMAWLAINELESM